MSLQTFTVFRNNLSLRQASFAPLHRNNPSNLKSARQEQATYWMYRVGANVPLPPPPSTIAREYIHRLLNCSVCPSAETNEHTQNPSVVVLPGPVLWVRRASSLVHSFIATTTVAGQIETVSTGRACCILLWRLAIDLRLSVRVCVLGPASLSASDPSIHSSYVGL